MSDVHLLCAVCRARGDPRRPFAPRRSDDITFVGRNATASVGSIDVVHRFVWSGPLRVILTNAGCVSLGSLSRTLCGIRPDLPTTDSVPLALNVLTSATWTTREMDSLHCWWSEMPLRNLGSRLSIASAHWSSGCGTARRSMGHRPSRLQAAHYGGSSRCHAEERVEAWIIAAQRHQRCLCGEWQGVGCPPQYRSWSPASATAATHGDKTYIYLQETPSEVNVCPEIFKGARSFFQPVFVVG